MANSENNSTQSGKKKRSGFNPIFYLAAGAYLAYLGYKLIKDLMDKSEISVKWYLAAAAVLFILGGIWTVIHGIKLFKLKSKMNEEAEKAAAQDAEATEGDDDGSTGMGYVSDDEYTPGGYIGGDDDGKGYIADDADGKGYIADEDDSAADDGEGYEDDAEDFSEESGEDRE